jgi:serine/threonine-protein kinase HipA
MKEAIIYRNQEPAGRLIQTDSGGYIFRYEDSYFQNPSNKSVSLTLSKKIQEYRSDTLFPFFSNMLSEGVNRRLQCRQLQIDENDDFSLLLATAETDTIGAVTIKRA